MNSRSGNCRLTILSCVLLVGLAVTACRRSGVPRSGSTPFAPTGAVTAALASATPTGSPTQTATADPSLTPEPTPDYPAALPRGAVVARKDIRPWYSHGAGDRDLEFVPYTLDGISGFAIVDVAAEPPERLWSLAEAGIAPPAGATVRTANVHFIEDGRWAEVVAVAVDDTSEVIVLRWVDDRVVVTDLLSVPDPNVTDRSLALEHIDLSGDGTDERILMASDPLRAWFYPDAGSAADAGSGATSPPTSPRTEPASTLEGPLQIMDVTGDGALEVLAFEDAGRWRTYVWRGEGLVSGDPVADAAAPETEHVAEGALPPMTRDLFFWRVGQVLRGSASGGTVEVVYTASGDAKWSPVLVGKYDMLPLRPYAVSRDGGRIVVVEQGCSQPKCYTPDYRFVVRDLATGSTVTVPWRRNSRDADRWPSYDEWDLSGDGRWLVIWQRADPSIADEAPGDPIIAADLSKSPPDQHVLARCTDFDAGTMFGVRKCEAQVLIAPDDRHVAYRDQEGLRVLDLASPDAGVPVLVPHHYGDEEGDIRTYSPRTWSPDNRSIQLNVGYYEGSSSAVVDTASGTLQMVPDTDFYGGPISHLGWFPDRPALVHARANGYRGGSPLRLVDLVGTARESTFDVGTMTAAPDTDLLPIHNLYHGANIDAVAPVVAPDGTIGFVLRDPTGTAYRGNGLFSVRPDGTGWTRLAALPTAMLADETVAVSDSGLWTDDASLLLLLPNFTADSPVAAGEPALLISGDGSSVVDIAPVVQGGSWFVWAGPRTP
jgi:hypothetical protein